MSLDTLPPSRIDDGARRAVWQRHGADDASSAELLAYARSPLHDDGIPALRYPLAEPPSVAAWEAYARQAHDEGALTVLRRIFLQLHFPVGAGMSADAAYLAATRRGLHPGFGTQPAAFRRPEGLRIFLHPTPAGRVPAVVAEERVDFETLVQAITRRNEPDPVPPSMGACMVTGFNNWDRVAAHRDAFAREHPEDWDGEGWRAAFRSLKLDKELYQDRFLLLSAGPYSGVAAEEVELDPDAWSAASVQLRLEHECTHYFTARVFGSARKSALDELVADYMGLLQARGRFRLEHFLRFMGLEGPAYREGGRLQNYRGPLGETAFAVLARVVRRAAASLARWDPAPALGVLGPVEKARLILGLTRLGLEGLAHPAADRLLPAAMQEARSAV